MVELPILLKRLEREAPIRLVQPPEKRPHKLHPAHAAEQLRHAGAARLVAGGEGDAVVRSLEVDVLRGEEVVGGAEEAGALCREGRAEVLDRLEEDEALAAVEVLDVRDGGREGLGSLARGSCGEWGKGTRLTGSFHLSARA